VAGITELGIQNILRDAMKFLGLMTDFQSFDEKYGSRNPLVIARSSECINCNMSIFLKQKKNILQSEIYAL
jgi:hypothetical protein